MNAFLFFSVIGLYLALILCAGMIVIVLCASILHYFPKSKAARIISDLFFDDEPEIQKKEFNVKAGDCISGGKYGN